MTRMLLSSLLFLSGTLLVKADEQKLCGKFQNQTSSDGRYNLGTNQWGADGSGGQCVFYDPDAQPEPDATAFTATWFWRNNINNVHSYPNVYLESREFPMRLNNTKSFNVDIGWTMGEGNEVVDTVETAQLQSAGVKANVAFDFFLDFNETSAANASLAAYEFMVWLGSFGGAQPLGYMTTDNPMTYILGSTEFTLYTGDNQIGQHVYSWYPTNGNVGRFTGDLGVLLHYTADQGLLPQNIYLGSVQFGSETTHAMSNVTWNADPVKMDVQVFVPKSAAMSRATAHSGLLLLSVAWAGLYWTGLL